jgi:hypothetical protein
VPVPSRFRLGRFAPSCALALTVAAGCGGSARPPPLGEERTDASAQGADASQQFQTTAPTELTCNLGPDGGVCACADQPLLGDPPTLYFILDRSGSMAENGKWPTIVSVLADLVIGLGPRANIGAAVFPDPNDANPCASGLEVAPPQRGDAPAGAAGPSATALLTILGHITANGGTPTAATLQALLPRVTSLPGKTYVILATDGGPNCNDAATCDASGCEWNIENATAACPPGGPHNCCTDPAYTSTLSCLDATPTIDAVKALADKGIPVYVIGVPGSAPYAALLDELAQAGGTARPNEPYYYEVNSTDRTALTAAISSVAAKITGTCTLKLNHVPPDPTLVNVFLGGQVLPQGGTDGWTLVDQTVTIRGASCQAIMDGSVVDVRVVAGCPTVFR